MAIIKASFSKMILSLEKSSKTFRKKIKLFKIMSVIK